MMKGQKGITLVALIITIIVMLILVGVSISVALNGGLFDKARDAKTKTQAEQVKEAIALAKADILADYYDGTISSYTDLTGNKAPAKLINSYLDGMTVEVSEFDPATGTFTVTPPEGVTLTDAEKTMEFSIWKTTSEP